VSQAALRFRTKLLYASDSLGSEALLGTAARNQPPERVTEFLHLTRSGHLGVERQRTQPRPGQSATGVMAPFTHRALELRPPNPDEPPARSTIGEIRRRDRLGGLLYEYYRAAA